jgi:hypothetical protein
MNIIFNEGFDQLPITTVTTFSNVVLKYPFGYNNGSDFNNFAKRHLAQAPFYSLGPGKSPFGNDCHLTEFSLLHEPKQKTYMFHSYFSYLC